MGRLSQLVQRRTGWCCLVLTILLVFSLAASISIGAVSIPLSQVWRVLLHTAFGWFDVDGIKEGTQNIILYLRVPRALLGALVGASLALSGVGMQAFTKNPLADPYVLGISSGASTGAVLAIVWGVVLPWGSRLSIPAGAFCGALLSILAVCALARSGGQMTPIRLVLVGDMAQLPPVGLDVSPALDKRELEGAYNFHVIEVNLTDVMRQAEQSGILYNATRVRGMIGNGIGQLILKAGKFPDVFRIGGGDLLEEIDSCYGKFGEEETIVVCRSNKRANRFNEGIRRTILYREEDFCSGDRIMVVRNNYFWGKDYAKIDFIANGDMATVKRVGKRLELYGFHFVKAELAIDDYEEELSAWVMLDTLLSESPALTYEQSREFYRAVEADYADIGSKKKRFEKIRENEFYNALQIKFAYAVTCHKAQGGQWDAVFIDQGYLTDDMLDDEYWRWLYTAITRARKRLYFINFNDRFFEGD